MGDFHIEEIKLEEFHKEWADECSKIYGGLDVLSLDVLYQKDGSHIVLEVRNEPLKFHCNHFFSPKIVERLCNWYCARILKGRYFVHEGACS